MKNWVEWLERAAEGIVLGSLYRVWEAGKEYMSSIQRNSYPQMEVTEADNYDNSDEPIF